MSNSPLVCRFVIFTESWWHVSPWQRSGTFHNSLTSLPPLPKPEVKGHREFQMKTHTRTHALTPCNRSGAARGCMITFSSISYFYYLISWCSIKGICSIGLYGTIQISNHAFRPINGTGSPQLHTLWLDTFQALLMRIDVYGNKPRSTNQPLTLFNVQ